MEELYDLLLAEGDYTGTFQEFEDDPDISDLLARGNRVVSEQKAATEQKEGQETVEEAESSPDKIKGTEK